jgi:hypothetical protein
MKKVILFFTFILLCCFSGCIGEAEETNVKEKPPVTVLFLDTTHEYAYILGRFEKGIYQEALQYTFNNKLLMDFIDEPAEDPREMENMKTVLLTSGDGIDFYSSQGEKWTGICKQIDCEERGIDCFVEARAILSQTEPRGIRYVGVSSGINSMPRPVIYGENKITVDLDGDGTMDVIEWNWTETKYQQYVDEDDEEMFDYTLNMILNGKKNIFCTAEDLPFAMGDFEVFVLDVNGDGLFEIVLYEKAIYINSWLRVYMPKDGELKEVIVYIINPGP